MTVRPKITFIFIDKIFIFPAKLTPVVWVKFKQMRMYILNNKDKTLTLTLPFKSVQR